MIPMSRNIGFSVWALLVLLPLVSSAQQKNKVENPSYANQVEFTVLPGANTTSVGIQVVRVRRFTDWFCGGLGIGFTHYNDPLDLVPIFVNAKFVAPGTGGAIPFASLDIGYSVSIHVNDDVEIDEHRGGVLISPSVGVLFKSNSDFKYYVKAGYNINKARYEQPQWGNRILETNITYKRLLFGVGLLF